MSFAFIFVFAFIGQISKDGIEKIRHAVEARHIADSWESGKYYYDNAGTTEILIPGVKVPEKPESEEFLILNKDRNKWIKYEDASEEDLEMYEIEYKRYFQGDIPEEQFSPIKEDPLKLASEEIKKATEYLIEKRSKEAINAQKEVIKILDEMIKDKMKNNSSASSSSSSSSNNSQEKSTASVQPGSIGNELNSQPLTNKDVRRILNSKIWGQLKNRNEKLETKNVLTEDFLPYYRKEIESYFENLAKDKNFR